MTGKPILILHCGVHRTATSSIQGFLRQNADALRGQGVLYPLGVVRHVRLVNELYDGRRDPVETAQDLLRRLRRWPEAPDRILISDEDIAMRRHIDPFLAMRDIFDLRVILSLRRQDLWLESWYLQNVKWQWDPVLAHAPFEEFLARIDDFHWIDYDRHVAMLEAAVGPENLALTVFERGQMPEGPIAAFGAAAGLDLAGLEDVPQRNASLSPLVSEFARRLPLDRAALPYRSQLEQALFATEARLQAQGLPRSALLLDAAQRAALMARFEPGNTRLAQRRFGRDRLFLDPLPPADAPLAPRDLPDEAGALMRDFVAPLIESLIAQDLQARENKEG